MSSSNTQSYIRVGQNTYHPCEILDNDGQVSYVHDSVLDRRDTVANAGIVSESELPLYANVPRIEGELDLDLSDFFEETRSGMRKVAV